LEIERSIQTIQLNYEQLLTLVRKAFVGCRKLDEWEILSGGALNTTYRFTVDQNIFVLRLYARDRAHCKTEKVIHQLIDGHVSTPKLIYVDEFHEPWAYSIFEFISGKHISEIDNENGNSLSYELGHVLATIHNFKLQQAGLFGDGMNVSRVFEVGSSPYFEETFSVLSKGEYVRQRLGVKLTDEAMTFIERNKDFFPIIGDNVCLTHSDFKPVNLLYSDGKVFVLDWEFAHAGIGILDFAILLRHRDQFSCDIEALAKGYKDFGGKLSENWFRSALITDFVNTTTLLDSPSERPQLFQQLKTIIENTIKNWDFFKLA
jgi:aminoglycoside phosphotransferase (APT) family kinase protein